MADLFEASVRITPKIDPAATKAEIDKGVVSPLKASAATIASVIGTIGLAKVFSGGLTELKQQQEVLTQTTALLKANAGAANVSAQAISAFAEAEQEKTGKDKEAVQAGENMLLQFRNVKNTLGEGNDIFTQASKLALDLSVATGQDLSGAYRTLGRALQDPEQGSRALRAANIILTASQKEQIKAMEDSGNTLGAQKYLLEQLQGQIGGVADAYGQTLPGKLERAKNELDDVKARVVSGLTPALEFAAAAAEKFGEVSATLPAPLQTIAAGLLAAAVVARPVSLVFSGLVSIFGAVADGIRSLVSRIAAMDGSLGKLGAQAGIASAGLIAVTLYAKAYSNALDDAKKATDDLTKAAQAKTFGGGFEDAKNQLKAVDDQVTGLDNDINNLHFYDVTKQNDLQTLKNGLADTHNQLTVLLQETVDLSSATGKSKDETFKWLAEQAKAGTTFQSSADALKAFTGAVDDTASAADDAAAASKRFDEALQGQKQRLQELTDQYHTAIDARTELVTGRLDINQADRDIRTAQRNLADALKDPNRTADTVAQAQDDLSRAVVRRADVEVEQANRVREAQTGQAIDATEKANIYNQSIDDQAIKIGNVGTQVDNLKIKLDDLTSKDFVVKLRAELPGAAWNTVKKVFGFGQGGDSPSTQDPNRDPVTGGRATGGPVNAGTVYRVGENGPETFTSGGRNYILPGENGQITPGGGGMTNVFNISNPDPMSVAREISYSLLQAAPGLHARQAA